MTTTTTTSHFLLYLLLVALFAPPLIRAVHWLTDRERRRHPTRLRIIEAFFSSGHWRKATLEAYPQLDDTGLDLIERGLKQYFRIVLAARGRNVAMPSQAVDAMWHAFILDTRRYTAFCEQAFGRYLHHTPAESMKSATESTAGIRRAWQLCCADERLDSRRSKTLPLLFAIDVRLDIPGGFRYAADCSLRSEGDGAVYCGTSAGGCGGSAGGSDAGHAGSDAGHGCGSGCGSGCGGGCGGGCGS